MFKKLYNFIRNLLTKKKTRVPLILLNLNYEKYKQGIDKCCFANVHPGLRNDKELKTMFVVITDYIKENYNMEDLI